LSWLIWNILMAIIWWKKNLVSLHNFRTYFFPLGEVKASFSYLLTTANNYRRFLCDFFLQKSHLALSISMQKYAENCSFYVLKVQKIVTFSAPNNLDPLLTLNMHLIINNALLWDQKVLYWRDSEIIKGAGLVLRPTTVQCRRRSFGLYLHKWGGLDFQSTIFEAFGLTF
jgi:hypothetical protein